MLQTITRRKIEYLFRSRDWTDDERRRIRRVEDMLFGAVFGMLDYVDETTQRQMLRLLLPWKQYPELQDVRTRRSFSIKLRRLAQREHSDLSLTCAT
jgi:hypothetical protein